jgi:hypothetical protein
MKVTVAKLEYANGLSEDRVSSVHVSNEEILSECTLEDRVAFLENQDIECFEATYTLQERIVALEKLVYRLTVEIIEATAGAELNSYPLNHIDKLKARVSTHPYV